MNKLRKSLLPVFTFARIDIKRIFRDKVAIFFAFVFPLIFLFVFGTIFGDNNSVSFNVAVINQSDSKFAQEFVESSKKKEVLDINQKVTTLNDAEEKMERGELDATIVLPQNFGEVGDSKYPSGQAQVLYDRSNQEAGQALGSILESQFKEINSKLVPTETPFTVTIKSTATEGFRQFDYVFSGLLGFTILTIGIFGPSTVFPRLKQRGVLRRYHTTPMRVWQYFTGNVMSNAVAGLLSVAIMFLFALTVFDLSMNGDYFNLAIIIILGATLMFGMGLAIGGWAKNENQAAPIANLISFPMMFLSGIFFPTFLMPEWLQAITKFIPVTPVVESIRAVVMEGRTVLSLGPELLMIAAWTVAIYVLAFKLFRWE